MVRLENERERLLLNSAVEETQNNENAKIYLSIYTDPDLQLPAEVTYMPPGERSADSEMLEGEENEDN